MDIDVSDALSYAQRDKKWMDKWLKGSWFLFIPSVIWILSNPLAHSTRRNVSAFIEANPWAMYVLALMLVICTLLLFFVSGYLIENLFYRLRNYGAKLPEWNGYLTLCMLAVNLFAGMLPHTLLFGGILYGMFKLLNPAAGNPFCVFIWVFTLIVLSVFYFLYTSSAVLSYANELKVNAFFEFDLIFKIMGTNFLSLLVAMIAIFTIYVVYFMISIPLKSTVIGVIFLPFILFYIYLVFVEILAQVGRNPIEDSRWEAAKMNRALRKIDFITKELN